MRRKIFIYSLAVVFCVIAVLMTVDAKAAYPEKTIEFVVHAPAGGGSDLFSRTLASILEKEGLVKQKIQVVNREGGGGTIALNYLHDRAGDPYVIKQFTAGPLSTLLRGTSKMKLEDITFINVLCMEPNLAFTRFESPFNDMKSVIEYAKKNPEKVSVAYGGVGGSEHICSHRVVKATGAQLNLVGFGGGGPAAVAILGGHVDLGFGNASEQMGQIEAKKVKALGTMTAQRIPFLPDVPTMKEQGINAVFDQPRGFWAPKNFPDYALKFWEEIFFKLTKTKAYQDYLKSLYSTEAYMKHKEAKAYVVDYLKSLKVDVDELGVIKK
ncbi:MAG: tripartite tricarboxylate transporter substrate binding protein [Candidatus Eisenbacteria bacterium]|nr:tripartite tricarboxylate transporter substrate binding protein [Candidatus Eisenbacteria bacterium]